MRYALLFAILLIGCTGTVQDKQTSSKEPIDCGLTDVLTSRYILEDPDITGSDPTMRCMGDAMMTCTPARSTLVDDKASLEFEILGDTDDRCMIRLKYGDEVSAELREWADTEMTCPVDIDDTMRAFKIDTKKRPGEFAFMIYLTLGFEVLNTETGCDGSMLEYARIAMMNSIEDRQ